MAERKYPNGELIPASLPGAYKRGDNAKNCANCSFYVSAASYCTKWQAPVRGSYVCAAWKRSESSPTKSRAISNQSNVRNVRGY